MKVRSLRLWFGFAGGVGTASFLSGLAINPAAFVSDPLTSLDCLLAVSLSCAALYAAFALPRLLRTCPPTRFENGKVVDHAWVAPFVRSPLLVAAPAVVVQKSALPALCFALLGRSLRSMSAATNYRVDVDAVVSGAAAKLSWSFTTGTRSK